MRKYLLLAVMFVASLTSVKAATEFTISGGMDTYYATDNATIKGVPIRDFATNNALKDRFALNNAIIGANANSDFWKATFIFDGYHNSIANANLAFNLSEDLWIEGGYFFQNVPGEYDYYSWNNYFTSYSLASQLYPTRELGIGLAYNFDVNTRLNVRVVNSGWQDDGDNNRSKSVSARLDMHEIVPNWKLSIGTIVGNEAGMTEPEAFQTFTAVDFRGRFTREFEGAFTAQVGTCEDAYVNDNGEHQMGLTYGLTAQVRYHFTKKFNAAARLSYLDEKDFTDLAGMEIGANIEYRPTSFSFMRLEVGYLTMSSENEHHAKVFLIDDKYEASRMQAAISAGIYFDIYRYISEQ